MTEKAEKFMAALSNDAALKEELAAKLNGVAPNEQLKIVAAFAKEKGFALEEKDLEPDGSEIEIDELGSVAGGGGCGCAIGGFGSGDGLGCSCLFAGIGELDSSFSSKGGCVCTGAGAGATNKKKK